MTFLYWDEIIAFKGKKRIKGCYVDEKWINRVTILHCVNLKYRLIPDLEIILTSLWERNQLYCVNEALRKITGIHPDTKASKRDFRVTLSPGGAGQNFALWNISILDDAFTTFRGLWREKKVIIRLVIYRLSLKTIKVKR